MKAYPSYKKFSGKWIDEIPAHWNEVNLKRITQFMYGDSLSKGNRDEGNIPVFGSNGIVGYHNHSITMSPCIIVGRKGSFGKVTYSEIECYPIDTTFFIDESATNNKIRWIYYLLQSLELDAYTKDSAVPGLSREDAYNRKAPFPELAEQQAIADFLDRKTAQIDTLIAKKQRLIELLQEYRTALINQAVTKGLDPNVPMKDSGYEWLGKIPEHWKVLKLKRFSKIINGSTPKSTMPKYWEGDIVWVTPVDLGKLNDEIVINDSDRKITKDGLNNCGASLTPKGSIILSTRAPIGHLAITTAETCTNQGCKTIVMDENKVNNYYIYYYLFAFKKILQSYGQGSTFNELSSQKLQDFISLFPPIEEQKTISEYLENTSKNIINLVIKINHQIELLYEFRKSLISEVVTGKIDVRNWKEEEEDGIQAGSS